MTRIYKGRYSVVNLIKQRRKETARRIIETPNNEMRPKERLCL